MVCLFEYVAKNVSKSSFYMSVVTTRFDVHLVHMSFVSCAGRNAGGMSFRHLVYIGVALITHVRNKNSNIQRRSPYVVKHKELLLKERICYLWEMFPF